MRRKRRAELAYWAARAGEEGELLNGWYEGAFTAHFGLDRAFYAGKRILDVGCGPRGSLEWAHDAAERVGVDPLASEYERLNGGRHAMRYVEARAEALPFADASFDVVSTFNSLDHVEDVDAVLSELRRVLAPGGSLLLLVETGRPATVTEPNELDAAIVERVGLQCVDARHYQQSTGGLYLDLDAGIPFENGRGWLAARFLRDR